LLIMRVFALYDRSLKILAFILVVLFSGAGVAIVRILTSIPTPNHLLLLGSGQFFVERPVRNIPKLQASSSLRDVIQE
ncbi:hypothetical protein H0H93_006222, partial [Arthromyces matolae]